MSGRIDWSTVGPALVYGAMIVAGLIGLAAGSPVIGVG